MITEKLIVKYCVCVRSLNVVINLSVVVCVYFGLRPRICLSKHIGDRHIIVVTLLECKPLPRTSALCACTEVQISPPPADASSPTVL